ncbi:MAG: extracellular solute-binding protein [Acetatifactor sp.]|nr:extracellular solute-binding protein [Acetatifactor sp.]
MKKRWIKRAIISLVAFTLAVGGLTACGGSNKQNNALAKENVYSYQEFSIPNPEGDYTYMLGSFHAEGRIYALMQVEHYSEDYYIDYYLLSFNDDGTDARNTKLEINNTVITEEEMSNGSSWEDGTEDRDVTLPEIGVVEVMPLSAPRDPADDPVIEDTDVDIDNTDFDADTDVDINIDGDTGIDADFDPDMGMDDDSFLDDDMAVDDDFWVGDQTWEYTSLDNLTYGDGAIYGIRNYNYSNYAYNYNVSKTYLCCWNLDGTVRWETEMEDSQNMWIQKMTASPDGGLTLILSGEAQYILNASPEGKMGEMKEISSDVSNVLNYSERIEPLENGSLFVIYSDSEDWTKQYAAEYDPVTSTLSEPVQVPSKILYGYNGMMKTGNSSDLIYSTNTGLYTYNVGDEDGTKIMDFINSDLYITSLRDVIELDDTHFVGLFFENYDQSKLKAGLFTYVPPEEIPDKKVLVLAGMWLGGDIKQRVIEFNRNSQEYRITIKDYSEYNSYEDNEAGQTKLNNDIITGGMPDILVADAYNTENIPIENYIAKGWLADINDFIKKDEELSQEEFLQNVFDAYSVKGKLYYVIPSFYVNTMVAKSSIVGDRTSWTMSDMMELQKSLPEGTSMMENMTRSNFFSTMLRYCGNDFIDVETGKCTFDSEAFIDLMEFAKSLPEKIEYEENWWMHYETQYREDRTILMSAYINSISGFNYTLNGTFGEDISYVGFPTTGGMGAFLNYNMAYCISSKSKNKDGAWEFLRYYLTDEYQESNNRYNFSVQKDIFEEEAQEALERPYWIDKDGNKEYHDEYFYMNGESFVLDTMTQDQIDKLVNYIYTIDNAYYYNTDIINIIQEEIDAFFADQKGAAEVANIIQRRAQVYVDENR